MNYKKAYQFYYDLCFKLFSFLVSMGRNLVRLFTVIEWMGLSREPFAPHILGIVFGAYEICSILCY